MACANFSRREGPVAIVYDEEALSGDAASRDVLEQMAAIEATLNGLGAEPIRVEVDLDLRSFKHRLERLAPSLVFNLVESLDCSDRLQSVVPMLLESWDIPFTGSGSAAMALSNHKIASKERLLEAGLPAAPCFWLDKRGKLQYLAADESAADAGDYIVKTIESHASLFIDDASIMRSADAPAIAERLAALAALHGTPFFAERYVEGREFNISVIETGQGLTILPPSEISFAGLPADKPRIVGYTAKWDEQSTEYLATPRSFDIPPGDAALLDTLCELSTETWRALGLAGYARVDFRVDASGRPFILEANANPCLNPDAGLAAATERAGHDYAWLVTRIVEAAQ